MPFELLRPKSGHNLTKPGPGKDITLLFFTEVWYIIQLMWLYSKFPHLKKKALHTKEDYFASYRNWYLDTKVIINRLLHTPPEIACCLLQSPIEIPSVCDSILSNQKIAQDNSCRWDVSKQPAFQMQAFLVGLKSSFFTKILNFFKTLFQDIFLTHRFSISMFLGSHNHCFHSIDFLAL